MGSSGLEPPTSRLSGARSNRLSYEPVLESVFFFPYLILLTLIFLLSLTIFLVYLLATFFLVCLVSHLPFNNILSRLPCFIIPATTYSPGQSPAKYPRPSLSSRSCSGWECVFPKDASSPEILRVFARLYSPAHSKLNNYGFKESLKNLSGPCLFSLTT